MTVATVATVIALVGQSNMVGFGQPVPNETKSPRVLKVTPTGQIVQAVDPVFSYDATYDGPAQPGVGPGYSFAQYLTARDKKIRVVLVPCAASGTQIAQWQKGQPLYQACLTLVAAAIHKTRGKLGGILFFQGESDTHSADEVNAWPAAFKAFVRDFRADTGTPHAPIVYAQIATPPDTVEWQPFQDTWAAMRAAQASTIVTRAAMITTSDLPYGVDLASANHFSPPAYQTIGQRFAQAWLRLTRSNTSKR